VKVAIVTLYALVELVFVEKFNHLCKHIFACMHNLGGILCEKSAKLRILNSNRKIKERLYFI
jgi:hypothetical protein